MLASAARAAELLYARCPDLTVDEAISHLGCQGWSPAQLDGVASHWEGGFRQQRRRRPPSETADPEVALLEPATRHQAGHEPLWTADAGVDQLVAGSARPAAYRQSAASAGSRRPAPAGFNPHTRSGGNSYRRSNENDNESAPSAGIIRMGEFTEPG